MRETMPPDTIVEDPFIANNPHIDAKRAKTILSDLSWKHGESEVAYVRTWGCLEVRKNADIANALDMLGIDWSWRSRYRKRFYIHGIRI